MLIAQYRIGKRKQTKYRYSREVSPSDNDGPYKFSDM
jgi:hypothetical protein